MSGAALPWLARCPCHRSAGSLAIPTAADISSAANAPISPTMAQFAIFVAAGVVSGVIIELLMGRVRERA